MKDDHSDLAILRALTEPSNKKSTKQEKIYPSELVTVLEELGSAENQNDETEICETVACHDTELNCFAPR